MVQKVEIKADLLLQSPDTPHYTIHIVLNLVFSLIFF